MRAGKRSWLRRAVVGWGVLYLVVAAVLLTRQVAWPLALYLALGGLVLVAGIVGERSGYRPAVDPSHGDWQPTGERFVDPSGGHLIEVRYNPATGQRAYIDVDAAATRSGDDPAAS